jgi:hypothetical protein
MALRKENERHSVSNRVSALATGWPSIRRSASFKNSALLMSDLFNCTFAFDLDLAGIECTLFDIS